MELVKAGRSSVALTREPTSNTQEQDIFPHFKYQGYNSCTLIKGAIPWCIALQVHSQEAS